MQQNFSQSSYALIELLKNPNSSSDKVQNCIDAFVNKLPSASEHAIADSLKLLTTVFGIGNYDNGVTAVMICGYLTESGYDAQPFIEELQHLCDHYLAIAQPLMSALVLARRNMDEEADPDDVEQEVRDNVEQNNPEQLEAFDWIENIYPCLVAAYCSNQQFFQDGKALLHRRVSGFTEISTGCYWLNNLFNVLLNEPVLIIDLIKNKGFTGVISGIADNFQLQLLLMSIKELGEPISAIHIAVAKGVGPQTADTSVAGRWDMCNWGVLSASKKQKAQRESDFWIWSEGTPADIEILNGRRVILLRKASYQRGLPVQRSFKLLQASVVIEHWLTNDELSGWLAQMQQ